MTPYCLSYWDFSYLEGTFVSALELAWIKEASPATSNMPDWQCQHRPQMKLNK